MKHSITMRAAAAGLVCTMLCTEVFALPPGRMVDISGRSLHVVESAGAGPVVVLEAGGGGFSSFWLKVQPAIRDQLGLRTISYDRAGLGWSDPGPLPYSIHDKADDLDALLTALDVDKPIVLVAHSYGGWVAQAFASRYPQLIGALVLVDPNSSYFFAQYPKKVARIEAKGAKRPIRGLQRIGLKLQRNWFAKQAGASRSVFAPMLTDQHQVALGYMLSAFGTTCRTLSNTQFPDVPTIMISRGRPQKGFPWGNSTAEAAWRDGHKILIEHLSTKQHWIAEHAAHAVVIDQPGIIVKAIAAAMEMGG
ncbi:MAG: alpha/beta fold hydrolase [Pseudomonadales bacterium]